MGGSVIAIALHNSNELLLRKVGMGCIPQHIYYMLVYMLWYMGCIPLRAAFDGSVHCNRVADEHKC